MQGIYTYIPDTNYVPREYSVAAILLLLFTVLISLVPGLNLLYYYYYYYYYYYCCCYSAPFIKISLYNFHTHSKIQTRKCP
jgi:hypothetical protein